jgi:hypothetical protein
MDHPPTILAIRDPEHGNEYHLAMDRSDGLGFDDTPLVGWYYCDKGIFTSNLESLMAECKELGIRILIG